MNFVRQYIAIVLIVAIVLVAFPMWAAQPQGEAAGGGVVADIWGVASAVAGFVWMFVGPVVHWIGHFLWQFDPLTLTILLLIFTALLSAFLKGRARDRCMKDFHDDPVFVELIDGRVFSGRLHLGNNGLEVLYTSPAGGTDTPARESYVLHKAEYGLLRQIIRPQPLLTDSDRQRRDREVRSMYNPSNWRSFKRSVRNFFNTIRDAFNEIFVLLVGRVKTRPGAEVVGQQERFIVQTQRSVTEHVVPASYDSLLETFIGRKVIAEYLMDGQRTLVTGLLKEYSAEALELLDARFEIEREFDADRPGADEPGLYERSFGLRLDVKDDAVVARNTGGFAVTFRGWIGEGEYEAVEIEPESDARLPLPDEDEPAVGRFHFACQADMILPRPKALIRHRAPGADAADTNPEAPADQTTTAND